jgi:hypothetical protein
VVSVFTELDRRRRGIPFRPKQERKRGPCRHGEILRPTKFMSVARGTEKAEFRHFNCWGNGHAADLGAGTARHSPPRLGCRVAKWRLVPERFWTRFGISAGYRAEISSSNFGSLIAGSVITTRAAELVAAGPDALFGARAPDVAALLAKTRRVAIVFATSDPVALGSLKGWADRVGT